MGTKGEIGDPEVGTGNYLPNCLCTSLLTSAHTVGTSTRGSWPSFSTLLTTGLLSIQDSWGGVKKGGSVNEHGATKKQGGGIHTVLVVATFKMAPPWRHMKA